MLLNVTGGQLRILSGKVTEGDLDSLILIFQLVNRIERYNILKYIIYC